MKREPYRMLLITACDEDNRLSCEAAVRIAIDQFNAVEYLEAEKGIWIIWDSNGEGWAFQKKGNGFSIDTPFLTYKDIEKTCSLIDRFWESGMQPEIELILGPCDPKEGREEIYHDETLRIQR